MPLNLLKKYDDLLEIRQLGEEAREASLRRIFERDFWNSELFFRGKKVYPIKAEGRWDMERHFRHLTTKTDKQSPDKHREFDPFRSERLHWAKTHMEGLPDEGELFVFSTRERDRRRRKDIFRTYIYNRTKKYVVVFEPQQRHSSSVRSYYHLTAFYLDESYGVKHMERRMRRRLPEIL